MNSFYEEYNRTLLEAMKERLPDNVNSAGFLMETLRIERSAAYRRLRGDICFTFGEASLVAKSLGLSLDMIIGKDRIPKITPFRMCMVEYETPDETDYEILEEHIALIRLAKQDPSSSLTLSANMLPQQIYIPYDGLLKYFFFKWIYYNVDKQTKAYHQVKIPERMLLVFKNSFATHLEFKETCFIFDNYIFHYLLNDLTYFSSIGLIREEDKRVILDELHEVIDYLEQLCITGKNGNGNEVHIYISNLNFNKSWYTLKILHHRISIIEAYVLNGVATTDKNSFEKVCGWMQSRRSMSMNISQCGELQRINFFNEQRRILNER